MTYSWVADRFSLHKNGTLHELDGSELDTIANICRIDQFQYSRFAMYEYVPGLSVIPICTPVLTCSRETVDQLQE